MSVIITAFLVSVIAAGTPLLLAAVGELVVERAGVLNLGVEGMMLTGAIAAFATAELTGTTGLGVIAALLAGMAVSLLFGVLTLTLQANQTATGLALTIFGRGFSALLGAGYVGIAAPTLPKLHVPVLSDIPVLGPVVFGHDALVYASLAILGLVAWAIRRTHVGLVLRAVGDSHDAAHALGYPVVPIRYAAVLFGGAMAGLAGAYMSLSYTPLWAQDLTAGRGWVAVRARHIRGVAAVLAAGGRLVVRRADVSLAVCPGTRRRDPVLAVVGAALYRHGRHARADLARCPAHPAEPAGHARTVVPPPDLT